MVKAKKPVRAATRGNSPQMWRIYDYVKKNPGCSKWYAAQYADPDNDKIGYQAIARAIARGILTAKKKKTTRGQVFYALYAVKIGGAS